MHAEVLVGLKLQNEAEEPALLGSGNDTSISNAEDQSSKINSRI